MFIKSAAIALVATLGTASFASADTSFFSIHDRIDPSSNLELGLVRSAADGVVEVYTNNGGQQGRLLGTAPVHAGANLDVKVDLGVNVNTDIVAVLKSGGEVLAVEEIDVFTR